MITNCPLNLVSVQLNRLI